MGCKSRGAAIKRRSLAKDQFLFGFIMICVKASPQPDITWLRNAEPVSPWANVINAENASTLVSPSSQYSDSGVYTITAKNSSGQNSFDIEVRVAGKSAKNKIQTQHCKNVLNLMHFLSTDEPKRPGPVELEQVVYGKVIITWAPSPDHDLDDRLHYLVAEHDSNTRVRRVIADRLFCNTFTTSVQPGREYHFRVYAINDMGLSDPSESPTWGVNELSDQ